MGKYLVGSDNSGGKDQDCVDTVCRVLEEAGKEVLNCGVTPNQEGNFRANGEKDDIGVFIVNGICLGTILSCNEMAKSGICKQVIIGIPKPLMNEKFRERESLTDESKKLALVNDGTNWPNSYRQYEHKYTVDGICNALEYVSYAYGETCEEVGQNILNGASGTDGTGGGDSSEKSEPTPMSYADMIKDLISVWDGDVECKIRQNKVYINKVPQPNPELWIVDGNNVVSGQAKVSDYNSDTINTLDVTYGEDHMITIMDEYLINRFGVVEEEIPAEKIVTDYSGDGTMDTTGTDSSGDGQGEASLWTKIAEILQKYFTCKDEKEWNSFIRSVKDAKNSDDLGKILSNHTKKKGQEMKSYVSIKHEIQRIPEMNMKNY